MTPAPETRSRTPWGRIVLAGVAAEALLTAVTVPMFFLPDRETALHLVIPPVSFLALAVAGWWAVRRGSGDDIVRGALTGAVAIAVYGVLTIVAMNVPGGPPMTFASMLAPAYLVAHALKLLGGIAGGAAAKRLRSSADQGARSRAS